MMRRDTLAFRTLLDFARQRPGLDEGRCRMVLELLSTSITLREALREGLAAQQLTEVKLAVLVVLYAVDPASSTPADLATYTASTRSAMTDILAQLDQRALVHRERATSDRRLIYISLTDAGRKLAEDALVQYLQNVVRLARDVDPHLQPQLLSLCSLLNEGSVRLVEHS